MQEKTIESVKPLRTVKNALTVTEFNRLRQTKLFASCKEITTRYDYFDTSADGLEAELYRRGIRLRVKVRGGFTFQYKQTGESPEEIKQTMTEDEYSRLMHGHIPNGAIWEKLKSLKLAAMPEHIGTTSTIRLKKSLDIGDVQLEQTTYPNHTMTYQFEYKPKQGEPSNDGIVRLGLLDVLRQPAAPPKLQQLFAHIAPRR